MKILDTNSKLKIIKSEESRETSWWNYFFMPNSSPIKEYMSEEEFLSYFLYLREDIGFDW